MRIAALLLWLALPLAGVAVYYTIGTPHGLWRYQFRANGDANNPFADRFYTSCTYVGWRWHEVTVPAAAGRCPWVRFFHHSDGQ